MRIFSIHSGWLWISLVAVVHLSACKKEILGPSPGVSRIVPKAVCQQQLDTEVTIFGAKMSPMPFDTLIDDPKLQLPTVELLQTQNIDGQPSSSGAVTIPDDPEHPEESRVTWRSEGEMSFEVFPNLVLNIGLHTVSVTNGNGANTTLPSSLLAVPPPELTELVPDLLCADQDSDLSLRGDFFIRLDSLEPTVEFTVSSTTTSVATRPTVALGTCRLLPGDSGAEACEQLDITVPDGTLGTGGSSFVNFDVYVHNPESVACTSEELIKLTTVPAPTLGSIVDDLVCTAQFQNEVTVTGTGFLEIAGVAPTLVIGGVEIATQVVTSTCSPVSGPVATVQSCTQLTAFIDIDAVSGGVHSVIVVNPAPADCQTSDPVQFQVIPPPQVDSLSLAQLCTDAVDMPLTITGTGFFFGGTTPYSCSLGAGTQCPIISINNIDYVPQAWSGCTSLTGPYAGELCSGIEILVPASSYTTPGSYPVQVTNPEPADCTSNMDVDLVVVPPPDLVSVSPAQVCSTGSAFSLLGTNFVSSTEAFIGTTLTTVVNVNSAGTQIDVVTPQLAVGTYDVSVVNPGGCDDILQAAIVVIPGPVLFFVDPPVLYNGVSLQVSLYIGGLGAGDSVDAVWLEDASGTRTDLTNIQQANQFTVTATVPAGLPEGDYTVFILDDNMCTPSLSNGVFIEADLTVGVIGIDPPFAWRLANSSVDITAKALADLTAGEVQFSDVPRIYLNPSAGGTTAVALRSVAFQDSELLNAVIPANTLTAGPYDLVVVNPPPGNEIGFIANALIITDDASPPPRVDSASPTRVPAGGGVIKLLGEHYRDPVQVDLTCKDPTNGIVEVTAGSTFVSDTQVDVTMPGTFTIGTVCVARLINTGDGTYFDYSAVSVGSPSGNLEPWTAGTPLETGRTELVAAAGRVTDRARYIYAIGGHDADTTGNGTIFHTTYDRTRLNVFGETGAWMTENDARQALPEPRILAGVARLGRFIFVVGGNDSSGAVDTVWRAQVLDPLAAPQFKTLNLLIDPDNFTTGLTSGRWIYRIASVFDAGDEINPSGESLAGDPIVVRLPDIPDDMHLAIEWAAVAGASAYRVYRTVAVGDGSGSERLLATVSGESYEDTGADTPTGDGPLPSGALGTWATVASLPGSSVTEAAREGAHVAVGHDPSDATKSYLYVGGGVDGTGAFRDTIQILTLNRDATLPDPQNPAWTTSANTLSSGRAYGGAFMMDATFNSRLAADETWIYFGAGRTSTGFPNNNANTEAGRIQAGGELGSWSTSLGDFTGGARAGYAAFSANDFLYAYGGDRGGGNPALSNGMESELGTTLPDLSGWNSSGSSVMTSKRAYVGYTFESARFFVIGGVDENGALLSSTDINNF